MKAWCAVMTRKIGLSVLLVICVTIASMCAALAQTFSSDVLGKCRKLFSYSGSQAAYFYGFKDSTLYSVKVLPQVATCSANVDGAILAVCHDDTRAYALYKKEGVYGVMTLTHGTGRAVCRTIPAAKNINYHSFAADGSGVYLLTNESLDTSVVKYDGNGRRICTYSLPQGAQRLLVNGGQVYAVSFSNEVYRLGDSGKTRCAALDCDEICYDAGAGHLYTQSGKLISLLNGAQRQYSAAFCVKTADMVCESSGGRLFAAVGKKTATLDQQFRITVENAAVTAVTTAEAQTAEPTVSTSASAEPPYYDSQTVVAQRDMTVKDYKTLYGRVTKMTDPSGAEITSGKLKTGCKAVVGSRSYSVIVFGDITMNGTVNSADVKRFMEHCCGKSTMSALQQKAADMNQDHTTDNRDLVLLAQSIN